MMVRRHALVTTLSLLSQFVYLGTKFVVAHLLCLSSLLFSSKLLLRDISHLWNSLSPGASA